MGCHDQREERGEAKPTEGMTRPPPRHWTRTAIAKPKTSSSHTSASSKTSTIEEQLGAEAIAVAIAKESPAAEEIEKTREPDKQGHPGCCLGILEREAQCC